MEQNKLLEILTFIGRIEGRTLESELVEIRKTYTSEELNEAVIVEKQHVAGFKYNKVIDEIIQYIVRYIHNEPYSQNKKEGGWWKFNIPLQITRKIDFISELTIDVEIEDFEIEEHISNEFGEGGTYSRSYEGLVGNTLNGGYLFVKGVSYNRDLSDYSIRNNLYHELTHEYENYKRRQNLHKIGEKNSFNNISHDYNQMVDEINKSGDDNATKIFSFIYYRLFNKSEMSAAASSTYAYLKSVKGKRKEMLKDLKKTQAYDEYEWLKKQIEVLKKERSEEWWKNKMRILWKNENADPREFKNWFLSYSKYYMKKYFHSMTSAAALYYDETEKKQRKPRFIITKDPSIVELKKNLGEE